MDTDAVARWLSIIWTAFSRTRFRPEKFAGGQKQTPPSGLITPNGNLRAAPQASRHPAQIRPCGRAGFQGSKGFLAGSDVLSRMHVLCEDPGCDRSSLLCNARVEGRQFWTIRPDTDCRFKERTRVQDEMKPRFWRPRSTMWIGRPWSGCYGPKAITYRRQIDRWTKQYRASEMDSYSGGWRTDRMAWIAYSAR